MESIDLVSGDVRAIDVVVGGVVVVRFWVGVLCFVVCFFFFFFNDTATTEIYTLSLHDALPI